MSTYKSALIEFEKEDDNGKHRLIFAYFGLSIYSAQILEETFSIMLWSNRIFKNKVKTNKEINNIINKVENSKKTMRAFIEDIKKIYSLTDKLTNDLKIVLEDRNYIVHNYFRFEIQKSYSELGQKEMLEFFGNFIDKTKKVDFELNKYYHNYTDNLGLTKERIEDVKKQMKQEEINRFKFKAKKK